MRFGPSPSARSRRMCPSGTRRASFPHAVVKKLGEMGLLGVIFPEELGGAGMGYVEYVLAIEELSRVDGSVGIIVAAHNSLCTNHIMLAGNDDAASALDSEARQRRMAGRVGADRAGIGLRCRRCSDHGGKRGDEWVLNGSKTFITNGSYANCAVVLAVTDKEKGTHGGISAFRRGARNTGLSLRQEGEQARSARQRHRRADLRELRDP